jgi:hypothetical protein
LAESGSDFVIEALSAVIVSVTARRNGDAAERYRAPGFTDWANTFTSGAIVIAGASTGNVIALIGKGAPVGSSDESQAIAAVVVGGTAAWNGHTNSARGAPGESAVTHTLAGSAVVVDRANRWDIVALVSGGAESLTGQKG